MCLTYAGEDSTKESNEYYVTLCPYAISDIVSHTGEPTADVTICSTAVPKSSSHVYEKILQITKVGFTESEEITEPVKRDISMIMR